MKIRRMRPGPSGSEALLYAQPHFRPEKFGWPGTDRHYFGPSAEEDYIVLCAEEGEGRFGDMFATGKPRLPMRSTTFIGCRPSRLLGPGDRVVSPRRRRLSWPSATPGSCSSKLLPRLPMTCRGPSTRNMGTRTGRILDYYRPEITRSYTGNPEVKSLRPRFPGRKSQVPGFELYLFRLAACDSSLGLVAGADLERGEFSVYPYEEEPLDFSPWAECLKSGKR